MKLRINVDAECIQEGQRSDVFLRCGSCPVARAMINAGLDYPSVGLMTASFVYQHIEHHITLSPDVADRVYRLDSDETVEPFAFDIEF